MTETGIPLANIYYLLCYAFDHVEKGEIDRVGHVQELDATQDLFGKILAEGMFRLFKGGLDRGYLDVQEELAGVRGKIELSTTITRALRSRGRVACLFQELSHDVLHNRILRSTLQSLIRIEDLNSKVRTSLRRADEKFTDVSLVHLNHSVFQRVQLDRNRRFYRFLLSICRLIHEQLLIDETRGETRFMRFNEERMEKLYEDFIIGFYRREQSNYSVNHDGRTIAWDVEGTTEHQRRWIPKMEADVILESPERRIIMDAKYYKSSLTKYSKLHSHNLYQLLAYLRNREAAKPHGPKYEGILLYPTVNENLSADIRLEGFSIRARSINLNQDWQGIHEDMLEIIA